MYLFVKVRKEPSYTVAAPRAEAEYFTYNQLVYGQYMYTVLDARALRLLHDQALKNFPDNTMRLGLCVGTGVTGRSKTPPRPPPASDTYSLFIKVS